MGLSRKTFLYSVLLAAVMVAFITGYFVFMLPSLYVDYVMESNLEAVVQVQKGYMETGSYDGLAVKNPSAMYTLEISGSGEELYLSGKFFTAAAQIRDGELREALRRAMEALQSGGGAANALSGGEDGDGTGDDGGQSAGGDEEGGGAGGDERAQAFAELWEIVGEKFAGERILPEDYPVQLQIEGKENQNAYKTGYARMHMPPGNLVVYESGVSDEDYSYTTYMAMGYRRDALVLTVFFTMTPRMEEITPVVLGSLPMIVLVVFLLVLVASRFFSGRIVNPIIRLAGCAQRAGLSDEFAAESFAVEGHDEIGALARSLRELYEKLRGSYIELERKNDLLKEENRRQEVFLRATSHQLKTPVAAALLLVEGMMGEVGKYRDTKKYLPEVKTQLLSMRRIVEDILALNYRADHMEMEEFAVEALAEEVAAAYAPQAKEKSLEMEVRGNAVVRTDREILKTIVDNLFSNAVAYTPAGGRIEAEITGRGIRLRNYGVTIEEKLLPGILEPFVSGSGTKGKGLGLYIAAYYSRLLGFEIEVKNQGDHVLAELFFTDGEETGGCGKC